MSDRPEPDRLPDTPHPRETPRLFGHDALLAEIAQAIGGERLHHGWLVTGPKGSGKATLAWAMARAILCREPGGGMFGPEPVPADLHVDPQHPVARRVAALSEPRLSLLRRPYDEKTGRLKAEIPVDAVRALKRFFSMSATDGGARVVIVDSADDLNVAAANALLKLLEEPPKNTVLILVSHQPGRLLPTIRSRCRLLRLAPLGPEPLAAALEQTGAEIPADPAEMARLARLAGGSVGTAVGLCQLDGLGLYGTLLRLVAGMPDHDRALALGLAEALSPREAEPQRLLMQELLGTILADLARAGVTGRAPGDLGPEMQAALCRLSPDHAAAQAWAGAQARIARRLAHGTAVNLDPGSLILDMVHTLDATASDALFQTGSV
ncbi:DNA polymerase III subunit delta' [Poseidonocella sp. HB161398]|uniref:DNA polymerase III subunit delta' n=1 Tax=Poseidonocella sp. HB161398 TaxID=2320855 RepID=UPI001108C572|nr:DNA polymerase III subunit delta' [Poseidonocella sp. HB161398]